MEFFFTMRREGGIPRALHKFSVLPVIQIVNSAKGMETGSTA